MNGERSLQPGPWHKTPAWRGGAFFIGLAVMLILFDWMVGGFFEITIGRPLLFLVVVGALLSLPLGMGWGARPATPSPSRELVPQAHVQGEKGSTYVIVSPPAAPAAPAGSGLSKAVRSRDLSPGWYALYTLFWRWPVIIGDYALTGAWLLVYRARGLRSGPPRPDLLHVDRPESLPRPDRDTF